MERPRLTVYLTKISRRRLLCAVFSGLLVLCGCLREPEPPVRIGTSLWPGQAPLFLARSLGWLDGKPLKLVEYPSTPEVVRGFQNGAIELGLFTADEFLRLSEKCPDAKVILVIDRSEGADALVGRPEFESISDLAGKKVGVEANSYGAYFLRRALDASGLCLDDIEVIALPNDRHVQAFEEGEVDALVTFEPHRSRLVKKGARVLYQSGEGGAERIDLLVANGRVLETRKPLLRELVTIWFKARDYLLKHPEDACALVGPRYQVSGTELMEVLPLIRIASLEENREMLRKPEGLAAELEKVRTFALEFALVEPAAAPKALVEGGLLP